MPCPYLSSKSGRDFDNGEARDVQSNVSLFEERLDDGCSRLNVIEFPNCAGIEEVPRKSKTLLAFGYESRSHRFGNLCQCRSHFFQCYFWQFLAGKAS